MNAKCETQKYYSFNYAEYILSTLNVDMTEHYNRFTKLLSKGATILDIGFGSGRDMLYFSQKGYSVFGVDNVKEFVNNARDKGLYVELCDFHSLPYKNKFDGVWACASLLHSHNLPLAFDNIYKALKTGGYIYLSMKYGKGSIIKDGRFYQLIDEQKLKELCKNLTIVEMYITGDSMKRNQDWLNVILSK